MTDPAITQLRAEVREDVGKLWEAVREGNARLVRIEERQSTLLEQQSRQLESLGQDMHQLKDMHTRNRGFVAGVVAVISGVWALVLAGIHFLRP